MREDIREVLFSRDELAKRVRVLADTISNDYNGKDLILVGVLKGGFIFLADLMREITIPLEVDFMAVSSYGVSTKSSGIVKIIKDLDVDIRGKDVLIVEDIVDSGLTLNHLIELLKTREPKSIKICTMFDKPCRRTVEINVEYVGFEIPDEFIIGYGLDYGEKYRNLPDLCILKEKIFTK